MARIALCKSSAIACGSVSGYVRDTPIVSRNRNGRGQRDPFGKAE
jgi:hypothetical protein